MAGRPACMHRTALSATRKVLERPCFHRCFASWSRHQWHPRLKHCCHHITQSQLASTWQLCKFCPLRLKTGTALVTCHREAPSHCHAVTVKKKPATTHSCAAEHSTNMHAQQMPGQLPLFLLRRHAQQSVADRQAYMHDAMMQASEDCR